MAALAPGIVQLCDVHLVEMEPGDLSFVPPPITVCTVPKCKRRYAPRLGYFSLLPPYQGERAKVDPIGRSLNCVR